MKVAVIGNCQARPLAAYLAAMCRDIELLPETIVHLSGPATASSDLERLDKADLLVAQSVQDGYLAGHLTTNALRARYPSKVLVWPNLFFSGNCADIAYLTTQENQRLVGPLGVYHNRFIFELWKEGVEEPSVIGALDDLYDRRAMDLSDSVEKSLSELRRRDEGSDVHIVDHIAAHWQRKRLFFTFNHPTAELLIELGRQIAEAAAIPRQLDVDPAFEPEPLNPIVPATSKRLASILGLGYRANTTSKGVVLSLENGEVTTSGKHLYSIPDMVKQSYVAYREQPCAAKSVRVTPHYAAT